MDNSSSLTSRLTYVLTLCQVEEAGRKAARDMKKAKKAAKAGMPKRNASAYLLWCQVGLEASRVM